MKPILFNTEMVRAILAGRKTVTRRVIKPQPDEHLTTGENALELLAVVCGFYHPGDILYVRETWGCKIYPDGINARRVYKADGDECSKWYPSIHMPRKAARIFLRVTDVRVERLKDMQPCDIAFEGFRRQRDFIALWNSTLKPADRALYGWDANPWVRVIEFERIEKEDISCR